MSSILITGGSGFIGRRFCTQAQQLGFQLCVLTRNPEAAAARLPASVRLIQRLSELEADYAPEVIVNLAGEPLAAGRWTQRRKQRFYDSRINLTDRLYDFCVARGHKPAVVISGSAIGYYGPGDQPLDEHSTAVDGFSHQLCKTWEQSAKRFETLGTRVCYLRTGIVLGEEGALARMLPPFKLALGGPIGSGKQGMSWIHINDMVGAILHCINNPQIGGPVNATAPHPVSNAEFSTCLGVALNRPARLPMPALMVKLLFGEMGEELLLQGQYVLPNKLLANDFQFQYPDLEQALQQIVAG
jgi:uncharacterized protein (TIGR01777 family)